jgi:hypothetical protein
MKETSMRKMRPFHAATKHSTSQPSYLLPVQAQELRIVSSLCTAREVAEATNATRLSTAA